MADKIDFIIINATYDVLVPLIKAHGQDKPSISKFIYYLLIISAALADKIGISSEQFKAMAISAFDIGKETENNKPGPPN